MCEARGAFPLPGRQLEQLGLDVFASKTPRVPPCLVWEINFLSPSKPRGFIRLVSCLEQRRRRLLRKRNVARPSPLQASAPGCWQGAALAVAGAFLMRVDSHRRLPHQHHPQTRLRCKAWGTVMHDSHPWAPHFALGLGRVRGTVWWEGTV